MAQPKRILSTRVLTLSDLRRELEAASDAKRAKNLAWFFKSGKGEYGEGDKFCGITVPALRKIASRYRHLNLSDIRKLLGSEIHEHRLAALLILVDQYQRGTADLRNDIFDFYLANTRYINNWDLVDASARDIVGEHLVSRSRSRRICGSVELQSLPHTRSSGAVISPILSRLLNCYSAIRTILFIRQLAGCCARLASNLSGSSLISSRRTIPPCLAQLCDMPSSVCPKPYAEGISEASSIELHESRFDIISSTSSLAHRSRSIAKS